MNTGRSPHRLGSKRTPSASVAERIERWPADDFAGLMEYVGARWAYKEIGYWSQRGSEYKISTGGWSGNEELVGAMMRNMMFFALCWQSSRRGGHYTFELP